MFREALRHGARGALLLLLVLGWIQPVPSRAIPASGRPEPGPEHAPLVPGEVLLQLTPEAYRTAPYREDLGSRGRTGLPELDAALASMGATRVRPALRFPPAVDNEAARELVRYFLVSYAGTAPPMEAAAILKGSPLVENAEPNGIFTATEVPDDPLYHQQWAHDNRGQAIQYGTGRWVGTPDCDTDTDLAWDVAQGSTATIIAIIDSGIDLGHPEFTGRLTAGYDFVNDDTDPADDYGHGTCCAGIAAASTDNAAGIAGIDRRARIMPVKNLDSSGHGTFGWGADAIIWAADHGARILSISWGSYQDSDLTHNACAYAFDRGCALFCAAGNDNSEGGFFPAAYTLYTTCVGALSPCNDRKIPTSCDGEDWWGSNYGHLDFLTPGVRMHSTDIRGAGGFDPGDYYDEMNGTSAATPHAAGIASLVLALNPSLTPTGLEDILDMSSQNMGAPGWDADTGNGRLNAHLAVLSALSYPTYVDASNTGSERGTLHYPYNTLTEGVNAVSSGGTIIIFSGTYDESITISKAMKIIAKDGTATIR